VVDTFKEGRWGYSLLTFSEIITKFYDVEKNFAGKAFDAASKRVKSKAASVPEACNILLAHHALNRRTQMVESLLGQLSTLPQRCSVSEFTPYPREFPATLKKLNGLQVGGTPHRETLEQFGFLYHHLLIQKTPWKLQFQHKQWSLQHLHDTLRHTPQLHKQQN
jgi:hypothetical protein